MPSTRTMYPNDRYMASPDIGSDGNRSAQSLTSNDFISESFRQTHSHSQIRDVQLREDEMDAEDVCEIAMKNPHKVEWKLPKEVELRSTGKEPFGLNFKLRVITQTKDGPKDLFLLVDNVKSRSPASKILNRGDLILSVNRTPTHCSQDEVNSEEFIASVKNVIKKAERLHLRIQSPRRRRQTPPSVKLSSFSRQGGHSMFAQEESVQPSLHTRPSLQVTDMLSYLRLAESTCQASILPKVPYSKIIVLGENNALLAKVLLGSGSSKMTRIESFLKRSFILKNSKKSSWERSFQVRPSVSTFKTWLRDAKNLKECLDRNVRHLIEAQLASPGNHYGCRDICGDNNSIFIDLFAPVHTNKHVSNLTASLLMTGNEVYVYDLPAARLFQETKSCLTEVQAFLSRIRSLAGRRVPVVLVVTHTGKLDAQDCAAIGDALKRFFTNSLTTQLVYFDNATPCCFVNLDEVVVDDGSLSSGTVGRECSLSGEITNFNTPLAGLRFKVMQLLWDQHYLGKYSVQFLRYHELFWRMIDQARDQNYYFRREIKEACCIRNDTDLSDFINYLKLLGELSGETSDAHDLQQTFLRPSSLHLPLTKMLTGISEERQHPHLREEWNLLETTGIASSALLRAIFDDLEESNTLSYLQMLGIMYPLNSLAAQSFSTPLPRNREVKYNLVTGVSTSVTQFQYFPHDKHSLRIKFSDWIPTGFLVKLVLKMIDNMNFPSIRWSVCQSGCYEINTGTGCTLLLQEDLLSTSITVSASFQERHLPNYILQLLIRISKELSSCEDERPIVGCDCPLQHNKDKDEMHVLDLDIEHNRDIMCGNQRLNEHSRVLFWLMKMNLKEAPPSTMTSVHYSQNADCVSLVASSPDCLNNMNPEVYMWLCTKLNVEDVTSQRDWRLVAANLGFKKEDIDFFRNRRPDCNPCNSVFERWMQTGMATVSRLRQVLEGIGRKDIVCELDRRCGYFPTANTE